MICCRAAWVVPIEGRPIRDGWVLVDRGRVVACGSNGSPPEGSAGARDVDLGHVAVMPGLVNAHTHFELSHLHGRIPAGPSFVSWIRGVMGARREYPDPQAAEILEPARRAIAAAISYGTAAIGDISNTLVTCALLNDSMLDAVVFYEIIGFNPADPGAVVDQALEKIRAAASGGRTRTSLAAHAPYSVAPALLRQIAAAVDRDGLPCCSVHLAESPEEVEFIRTGGGPWRQLLEDFGVWNPDWAPAGVSPVRYLDDQRFLGPRVLAVHGVQMTDEDLGRLNARQTTLVTCPRSNEYTRAGRPPVERFYRAGVRVAIGTDSLASAPDLNVFSELAAMRALAPNLSASLLLDSATRQGARALGLSADYGTIEKGKRARLIAVSVPAAVDDVEEYLVSGIEAGQIRWIEDSTV